MFRQSNERPQQRSLTLVMILVFSFLFCLGIWMVFRSSSPQPSRYAIATLVTDSFPSGYICGAIVLARSIKQTGSIAELVVMTTPEVDATTLNLLRLEGFHIFSVPPIPHPDPSKLLAARFLNTYTKLQAWSLIQYEKVIIMDADMVVLKPVDHLFEIEELGAAVDCCDKFNSGLMVLRPSSATFRDMLNQIATLPSYDGGDQRFLNEYFQHKWQQIPYIYNAVQTTYSTGAWQLDEVAVLHLMEHKPWKALSAENAYLAPLHDVWWGFSEDEDQCYHPSGTKRMEPSLEIPRAV